MALAVQLGETRHFVNKLYWFRQFMPLPIQASGFFKALALQPAWSGEVLIGKTLRYSVKADKLMHIYLIYMAKKYAGFFC